MSPERIDRILAEYEAVREPAGDPELAAVTAAVFVEDAFGIHLSDSDIDPEWLVSPDAMRSLVMRKLFDAAPEAGVG